MEPEPLSEPAQPTPPSPPPPGDVEGSTISESTPARSPEIQETHEAQENITVPETPLVSSVESSVHPPTPLGTPMPRKRRSWLWLWVPVLTIIVAGGLYVVYHYGQSKQTPVTAVHKDIPLLRIATGEPLPASYYPNIDDSAISDDVSGQAFEGLTGFEDQTKIVPRLAVSWTNPNNTTWLFRLRPNVKFHTGRTMTATDVVDSLEGVQKFSLGPEYGSAIDTVSVVNPLMVKITTKGPDPILPNELAYLWIYDTTSKTQNNPINGTGPYTVSTAQAPKGTVELSAFDGYWDGRPHVRAIQFSAITGDNDTFLQTVKSSKYDIVFVRTMSNVAAGEKLGYKYLDIIIPNVAHLMLNSQKAGSPLSKLTVRNALMGALDPETILKARQLAGMPASQIIPSQIPGYDPGLTRPPFDSATSKAAIAAAGYPHGFSITLTYYVTAQDLADEVKKELAAVGVTVNEDPESDLNVLGQKAFGGGTDMYYISDSTSLVDASDVFSGEFVHGANYDNPKVDQLFTQAGQTLDQSKRLAILQHISRLLVQDRADLPLYSTPDTNWLIRPNIVINQSNYGGSLAARIFEAYGT